METERLAFYFVYILKYKKKLVVRKTNYLRHRRQFALTIHRYNNTMAGKKKELCTRYTNIKFNDTCRASSFIHRQQRGWGCRWRRRHHCKSIIIFNGHRYTAHTRHQSSFISGRQGGCRKKQTKWNETASPFTAATLCKISWRIDTRF